MIREIPLEGGAQNAHQTISVMLAENDITLRLNFQPYVDDPVWCMDVLRKDSLLVAGICLRCGCDLLGPYQLGIGKLVVIGDEPTLDNLGKTNQLVWISEDETFGN